MKTINKPKWKLIVFRNSNITKIYIRLFIILYAIAVVFSLLFNKFNPDRPENLYSCFALDDFVNCSFPEYVFNSFIIFPFFLLVYLPIIGIISTILYGFSFKLEKNSYILLIPLLALFYYISILITWLYLKLKNKKQK